MLRALVVDDDKSSSRALAALATQNGFEASTAGTLAEARSLLAAEKPDVVLVDLMLPDGSGVDLLEDLVQGGDDTDVVVITGHASMDSAIEALRRGATDYLTKPADVNRLKAIFANLARTHELRQRVDSLRDQLRELGRFGSLVGSSPAMQRIYDLIERVAPTNASVLISGESGTGKELVAETIHRLSRRSAKPYLIVNCGAISPNLIESELFGHERGSFTGAERTHRGLFERAQGGTLMLDEIGEMPLELQVKLLRVLETGDVVRVGGDKSFKVDVRIVAATNRDLEAAVEKGDFRGDLLYRLKVFPIELPPLREREDDVEILGRHFLAELNRQEGTQKVFNSAAIASLHEYSWPGNVRELRNAIHRAFIMASSDIDLGILAKEVTAFSKKGDTGLSMAPGMSLEEVEKKLILASLEHFKGDKKTTAEKLGISIKTLYNRLNQYGSS